MIGIESIGIYVPENRISNYDRKELFGIDDNFIENKIGFQSIAIMEKEEDTSDLCVKAFQDLDSKRRIDLEKIDAMIVVTQNPDSNIPHTSAIVHGKLGLSHHCACFDISLGCSGFAYALSVMEAFMERNGFKEALIFTADPYSKIINPEDKSTALLFGDGAAVTLLSTRPKVISGKFTFGTIGEKHENLICSDGILKMNGRAIFDFAVRTIPKDVQRLFELNGISSSDEIDVVLAHQGSKFIVNALVRKLRISPEKMPFKAGEIGNTISSTIPMLLNDYLDDPKYKQMLITGFGVGLSWASTILKRVN